MEHSPVAAVLPYAVNFSIVVIFVFAVARKPFQKVLFQRHEHIKDAVESAEAAKRAADERIAKANDALKNLAANTERLLADERRYTQEELARINEQTRADLGRINLDSKRIVENEDKDRAQQLRASLIRQVTEDAAAKLRKGLRADDHAGLVRGASSSIEANV